MRTTRIFQRVNQRDTTDVALFLMAEMEECRQLHGHNVMHLQCAQNGLTVHRRT